MGFFVIVEIAEQETAEFFVKEWIDSPYIDVVNVQKKPDNYCHCGYSQRKGHGYTQGKIYHWWVCPNCNLMSKRSFDNHIYLQSGRNLLPKSTLPPSVPNTPELESNYDSPSPREWTFLEGLTQL